MEGGEEYTHSDMTEERGGWGRCVVEAMRGRWEGHAWCCHKAEQGHKEGSKKVEGERVAEGVR